MSEIDHELCRYLLRDEAVRAAEDAAAVPSIQHRDLPEVVADLRERVARVEAAVTPKSVSLSNAEGLRTERVTLEVTQRTESYAPLSEFDWTAMLRSACRGRLFDGESVRVVDEADAASDEAVAHGATLNALGEARESLAAANRGIARLSAERDAAILERRAAQEEVEDWSRRCARILDERDAARARVAELEAAAPPRGWLTAEEREAVDAAADAIGDRIDAYKEQDGDRRRIEVLDALLARETPPRVRRPNPNVVFTTVDARERIDRQWIAAIRAAGGEVEE